MMGEKNIVAIHQPNCFPWLGFFDKFVRADVFILLDHVQIQKTGGTWGNHVKILFTDGKSRWITIPIKRSYHGFQQLKEVRINSSTPWQKKILKTLWANYGRAPYYPSVSSFFEPLIMNDTDNLVEFNRAVIEALVHELDLTPSIVRSSDLNIHGASNEMLIALIQSVGGTAYLCGGGASEYMDNEKYSKAGIDVIYQNFRHPIYPQIGNRDFIPGLSIVDALMNVGFNGVKDLLTH